MKFRFAVVAFSVCLLSAQTPNLSGVWKANTEKSKFAGPAPTTYLMIIEQKDSTVTGKVGMTNPRGEDRSSFLYNTAKPSVNSFRGVPVRTKSSWDGNALVVVGHMGGARPGDMHDKYVLAPDGKTLTLESTVSTGGADRSQTIVFEKQPDSAGEALNKPEETAGAHHTNLKLMAGMPNSNFMDAMRYFAFALGKDCQFCHVQGNFASDDKPEKATARMMIAMNGNINKENFKGNTVVRCFTCHQGHPEPVAVPE